MARVKYKYIRDSELKEGQRFAPLFTKEQCQAAIDLGAVGIMQWYTYHAGKPVDDVTDGWSIVEDTTPSLPDTDD